LGLDAGEGWAKGNGEVLFLRGRRKPYLALCFFCGRKIGNISKANNDSSMNDENMMVVGEDVALAFNLKFVNIFITNSIVEL